VNVGLIEGGTAKNTVPDRAACVIDTRFETREDAEAVRGALRRLANSPWEGISDVPERLREARVELDGRITRLPLEASDASQALRLAYETCAAAVGLSVGEAPLQGGGSDANLLSALGVPSIDGLGPYGKHFHKIEEWSSLSSLRRRTQALACFLVEGWERARPA
jgi:glutamate carboxypeptidase